MVNVNVAVACIAPSAASGPRSATSLLPPAELSLQVPLSVTTLAASKLSASFNPDPPIMVTVSEPPVSTAPSSVNDVGVTPLTESSLVPTRV